MRYVLAMLLLVYGCAVSPQQRMKDCNAAAGSLKGSERQSFMSQCLKW